MRINLPYAFHVTGKVGRKMDRVVAGDFKSFELPVTDTAYAPVCLSFEQRDRYCFFDDYALNGRADIRYFDGAFYRAKTDDGRSVAVETLSKRALVDYSEFDAGLLTEQVLMEESGRAKPRPSFQGETYTDEHDILERLEDAVGRLLVIDGTVWEKCPEPVLIVEEDLVRHKSIYVSPGFMDTYTPDRRSSYYVFDIDQHDEVLTFARRRSAHVGEDITVTVSADVSVFAPELLVKGHAAADILRYADGFLQETGRLSLNHISVNYNRSWRVFQEALAEVRYEPTDEGTERMFEAWSDMVEAQVAEHPVTTTDAARGTLASWREFFDERPVTEASVNPKIRGI